MTGEEDLSKLIKHLTPKLNPGKYVFSTVEKDKLIDLHEVIATFKEKEGITIILEQSKADELGLTYDYVASWITLQIHSSLEAVGLTAAFSTALANDQISCNVVAGYYHDHIFVNAIDENKALEVLKRLSN
ncbi:MAG: ACT domain-containing protein [Cytophagales bacterium]|nr:ACT domain-containing protein [Cytophagales bacterium]